MSAMTIAMLVEAVTGIATISREVTGLIGQIQSRRKVPEAELQPIREQVENLQQSTRSIGRLAHTLNEYINTYLVLVPIKSSCDLLRVYVRENLPSLRKKRDDEGAWSVVFYMFSNVSSIADSGYERVLRNPSGLLDRDDLNTMEPRIQNFNETRNRAGECIRSKLSGERLLDHVERMNDESQKILSVLQGRIDGILHELTPLQFQ
ncbi:MAG: hypothetical protein ACE5OS_13835 [Anaerolineae bacterium]